MRLPKIYYGWYITGTLAITETVSFGVLYYAFSVFITPLEATMGWSRSEITGALSLAFLVSAFAGFGVGYWLDKYGARFLMTLGSILATLLMFAWAYADTLRDFYLVWFGIGLCMSAVLYEPAFVVVANWFDKHRSMALAIVTLLAGFASTIFLPLTQWLIDIQGWQMAIISLGLILGVTTIPLHGLVLRSSPDEMGLQLDGAEPPDDDLLDIPKTGVSLHDALRTTSFWAFVFSFSVALLASSAIRVHFIPYLQELEYSAADAAWLAGLIGAMQVLGRLIFAPLERRLDTRHLVAALFIIQTVAMVILFFAELRASVMLFVVIFGASYGATTLARPVLLADLYGRAHYGRINSVSSFVLVLSLTAAPIGAGILYEQFGSYQPVIVILVILSILATGSVFFIKDRQHDTTLRTS